MRTPSNAPHPSGSVVSGRLHLETLRSLPFRTRIAILAGLALLVIGALLLVPPLAQDPNFHLFVDDRAALGIPNFANVASNVGFLVFGFLGLQFLVSFRGRAKFHKSIDRLPYGVFFAGVALVSLGSAHYHADPTNETLIWDRMPMAVAFMGLFAAFIMDRVHFRIGLFMMLPLLTALGAASVALWHLSEIAGAGDLRPYIFVQFFPILAVPLICFLFRGYYTSGMAVFLIIVWYGLAKVCEHYDAAIYAFFGHTISGHTIKHLLAAMAVYEVIAMLRRISAAHWDGAPGRLHADNPQKETVN